VSFFGAVHTVSLLLCFVRNMQCVFAYFRVHVKVRLVNVL